MTVTDPAYWRNRYTGVPQQQHPYRGYAGEGGKGGSSHRQTTRVYLEYPTKSL